MDTDAPRGDYIHPRRSDKPFSAGAETWRQSWIALEPKTRAGYESILAAHPMPQFGDRPRLGYEALDAS